MNKPLIALTGGTGFIGQHLLRELGRRDFRLRVLLRRPSTLPVECASAVVGDLMRPQNMSAALADVDAVIHSAGIAHAMATPREQVLADIAACRDYLKDRGKVVVVGYCYGGSFTWLAAGSLDGIAAASSYYGSMVQANATLKPKCPTIVHLGRLDHGIPADDVKAAVQTSNPDVPVYIYEDAGHSFNNEDPARHAAASAELARKRTLELFGG